MEIQVEIAEIILESLRYKEGQLIQNPDGEWFYLKRIKGGLTDCCEAAYPCDEHNPEGIQ